MHGFPIYSDDCTIWNLRQSEAGQALKSEEIRSLLYQTIDIVLQFDSEGSTRFVKEAWYKPDLKRAVA
jgi:type IV secretion system protein VirB11